MVSVYGDLKEIGGSFQVKNGKISVSDAHNYDGLERVDVKAKNGQWNCYMYHENNVPTAVLIAHEDLVPYLKDQGVYNNCIWDMKQLGKVSVDSGMAGFFSENTDEWTEDDWSWAIDAVVKNGCLKTDDGFFSQTYDGDGTYPVYGWKVKGNKAVGLCIQYKWYKNQ